MVPKLKKQIIKLVVDEQLFPFVVGPVEPQLILLQNNHTAISECFYRESSFVNSV